MRLAQTLLEQSLPSYMGFVPMTNHVPRAPRAIILLALLAAVLTIVAPARVLGQESQIDSGGLDLFEKGQRAHEAGRLDEALDLYDRSLVADPEFWGAHYQRGIALLQLDRPADAEAALKRAIELDDFSAAAHAALGDALAAQERLEDAEKEYKRALEVDPALISVRINLAIVHYRRNADAEADRELTLVEEAGRATFDSHLLHAEVLKRMSSNEKALAAYGRALALDPKSVPALVGRGDLRVEMGDTTGGLVDLREAYSVQPTPDLAGRIFDLEAKAGNPERALEQLKAIIAADPANLAARRTLVDVLVKLEKHEEASREVATLVEAAPSDPEVLELAGDMTVNLSPKDAAVYYLRAVRLAPDDVDLRMKLGGSLLRAGNPEAAIEHFRAAVERAPDRIDAHKGLADALSSTNRYEEAAREFAWIVEREPDNALAYFYLGANVDRTGDCLGALAAFERFLALADRQTFDAETRQVDLRVAQIKRHIEEGKCKDDKKKKKNSTASGSDRVGASAVARLSCPRTAATGSTASGSDRLDREW